MAAPDSVTGYHFLVDLTDDERQLANDPYQRERALWQKLRTNVMSQNQTVRGVVTASTTIPSEMFWSCRTTEKHRGTLAAQFEPCPIHPQAPEKSYLPD